ncbi:MAG: hypothetical protein V4760_05095 [Bdellovibrionota bacterium]
MKQIKIALFTTLVLSLSSFSSAQTTKTPVKKKTVTTTTTKTVTEEPAATPTPEPVVEAEEKTTGEKVQEAADKAADGIQDAAKKVGEQLGQTASVRAQSDMVILGNLAPIDLIVGPKLGLSLGWVQSASRTLELEYVKGSIKAPFIKELGEVSDTRISLMSRSYSARNSFNFTWGVSYMALNGRIGDELLSRLSGGSIPNVEFIGIESVGLTAGIGNRWIFSRGITFGVDWFTWSQPIIVTKKEAKFLDYVSNQNDKDNMQKAIDLISVIPHFSLLKLQFGMTF